MEEYIQDARDKIDHQIFREILIGKTTNIKQLAKDNHTTMRDVRKRRDRMMVDLRTYLDTVGIASVADIEMDAE
jgi:hypothetical protein